MGTEQIKYQTKHGAAPPFSKSKNKHPTIGLLIEHTSGLNEGYLSAILTGITDTVRKQGINLYCFAGGALNGLPDVPFDNQRNILYQIASSKIVDGLIIFSSVCNYRPIEELKHLHANYVPLPTLSIGAPLEGISGIIIDNKKGFHDMLSHLVETHNYRRIAFLRGPEDSPDAKIRYQTFRNFLATYGIQFNPNLITSGDFRVASGAAAIQTLIDERKENFEVLVCANDHMALGAIEELQTRGIAVPYDIAVIGFDDIEQARNILPPLTTVQQPLFELGRKAVTTLMSHIIDRTEQEQLILSTKLVVRHSCGCIDPSVSSIPAQLALKVNELNTENRSLKQDVILAELSEAINIPSLADASNWVNKLLDCYYQDVRGTSKGLFLKNLGALLQFVMREDGDILSGQKIVLVLRRHTISSLDFEGLSLQAEILLQQAQVFIEQEMRRIRSEQYFRKERQNTLLISISQSLITTFEIDKLMDIIADNLPRLGIPSCYLILYEDSKLYNFPQPPSKWSLLILAYNKNGRIQLNPEQQRFLTQNLLPEGILSIEQRHTMIIQPLFFREEQIGYILLEKGQIEGHVYEVLRGQISSALKGALLVEAYELVEFGLRQHQDHLDELVQARTTQLTIANEQLQQEIEERERAETALKQSRRNLAYAQKIAKLGYYHWNIQSDEVIWSDEMYHIFGVDQSAFHPTVDSIRQFLVPTDQQILSEENFTKAIKKSRHQMKFRIIDQKTGSLKHLYLWGESTFDKNANLTTVLSIIQDITKQQETEIQLEAYTAELERSNRELQEFAYVASHDLQEPLRKIQTFSDRLQQKYRSTLDEKGQNYLDRMQNSASHMQALIIDLLTFSRIRTQARPFKQVNLNKLILQVIQDFEITITEVNAKIVVSDLPTIEADALQMSQLFQNLLGNALKFSRPDIPLIIEVQNQIINEFCEISVVDNGIGFEEKYADRIFTVFERLHNRDEYPGTGIGLSICRRIVERHQGSIRAWSKVGEGATFIINLPIIQPNNS